MGKQNFYTPISDSLHENICLGERVRPVFWSDNGKNRIEMGAAELEGVRNNIFGNITGDDLPHPSRTRYSLGGQNNGFGAGYNLPQSPIRTHQAFGNSGVQNNKLFPPADINQNQNFNFPPPPCEMTEKRSTEDQLIALFNNFLHSVGGQNVINSKNRDDNVNHLVNKREINQLPQNSNILDAGKQIPMFDNQNIHPVEFLEHIEHIYHQGNMSFDNFRFLITNNFKGEASLWRQAFLHTFENFQDFKAAFLNHFWSESTQLQVKLRLQAARYNEGSLTNHFMKCVNMAKHLSQPFPELFLIKTIAQGFPPNVSSILIGTQDLGSAMERLRQADYYFNSENKIKSNPPFSEGQDRQRTKFVPFSNRERGVPRREHARDKILTLNVDHENNDTGVTQKDIWSGNEEAPHDV